MRDLTFRAPLALAIQENATSPEPSGNAIIWSTSSSKALVWDGAKWAALSGASSGATPGGSANQVQYNSGGTALAGATNVTINSGDLVLAKNDAPVTPGTDSVKLFGKRLANRVLPASVGPSGLDAALQPSMWRQKIASWNPPGNGTAVPGVLGLNTMTAMGTPTARTVATTNLFTRTRRFGYVSAATAGLTAGMYSSSAQWTTGDGAGLGGFFFSCRFAFSDAAAVSGARAFVGMSSSTAAATNVEPSTLTNSIGIAQLSTSSTQLYLVYGGSTAQTAIALGTSFPPMAATGATGGQLYDLTLFAPPNSAGVVHYRVEKVGTTVYTEGTLTPTTQGVQTPSSTTLLAPRMWRCNNASALAVGIDIVNLYIETDY